MATPEGRNSTPKGVKRLWAGLRGISKKNCRWHMRTAKKEEEVREGGTFKYVRGGRTRYAVKTPFDDNG
jgi:hypothetical protein